MIQSKPLVSIGLPVYNGGDSIARTAASLLAQDYLNFELIISDNGSTDTTSTICRDIAARDSRVRYYRNDENIGMFQNYNRLFGLSKGEYFMWSGAHDLWDPNFISACVSEFSINPKLVLCSGIFHEIDMDGNFMKEIPVYLDTRRLNPGERLSKMMREPGCFFGIYGLLRSDDLRKTILFRDKAGSDALLIYELSLLGEFRYLSGIKMYARVSSRRITLRENTARLLGERNANTKNGFYMARFPYCQATLETLRLVYKTKISRREKVELMLHAIGRFKKNIAREMTVDFLPAPARSFIKQILGKPQTA